MAAMSGQGRGRVPLAWATRAARYWHIKMQAIQKAADTPGSSVNIMSVALTRSASVRALLPGRPPKPDFNMVSMDERDGCA